MKNVYKIVVPSISEEGFSAFKSSASASADLQFTSWDTTSPYYSNANFNAGTGIYTIPTTGKYSIEATINYATNLAITGSIGAGVNPNFAVERTSPAATIISGYLPLNNIDIALVLTLRAVLGGGTVTLAGEASLSEGDALGLYYNAATMSLTLDFSNIVWSVYRIA